MYGYLCGTWLAPQWRLGWPILASLLPSRLDLVVKGLFKAGSGRLPQLISMMVSEKPRPWVLAEASDSARLM